MKEIAFQIQPDYTFVPYGDESMQTAKEYRPNQIVKGKISGFRKPRSVIQLNMFWACCKTVAENTDDPHWNTKDKVAFQVKVALQFVDMEKTIVDKHGNIHLHYRSISFKNLPHMAANRFFDRSWPILAKKIGVTEEELLKNANH